MKRKLFLIMVIALLLLISSIPVSAKNLSKYQTVKTKEKTFSTGIVEKGSSFVFTGLY